MPNVLLVYLYVYVKLTTVFFTYIRQIDRQVHGWMSEWTVGQIDRWVKTDRHRQTSKQKGLDRKVGRQINRQIGRHINRQINRHIGLVK